MAGTLKIWPELLRYGGNSKVREPARETQHKHQKTPSTHFFIAGNRQPNPISPITARWEGFKSDDATLCSHTERSLHLVFGARGVGVVARALGGGGQDAAAQMRKPCAAPLSIIERKQKLITCSSFTALANRNGLISKPESSSSSSTSCSKSVHSTNQSIDDALFIVPI